MTIEELLRTSTTIAVVGLSADPTRESYGVAKQLQRRGYTIIPVNPRFREWEGIPAYSYVSEIPNEIAIDIVDIFRKSEATPDVVRDVLKRTNPPRCIWLQLGITNEESAQLAEAAGIFYVENRCTAVETAVRNSHAAGFVPNADVPDADVPNADVQKADVPRAE